MRCEIAASLLHKPEILFLDEPTIGLDAVSKVIVRNFIKKINKEQKVTVILTTHDMSDIESLAKRVIMIGNGKVLYDGTLSNLKKKYGVNKLVHVTTKEKINKRIHGVIEKKKVTVAINLLLIQVLLVYLLHYKISKDISIEDIDISDETLDNIIIKLYEDFNI